MGEKGTRVINELLGIRGETRATPLSLRRKQRRQQSIGETAQLPCVSQHEPPAPPLGGPLCSCWSVGTSQGPPWIYKSINLSWALSDVLPSSLGKQLLDFNVQYSDRPETTALFCLTISKTVTKSAYIYTWKTNYMPRILPKQAHLAGKLSIP